MGTKSRQQFGSVEIAPFHAILGLLEILHEIAHVVSMADPMRNSLAGLSGDALIMLIFAAGCGADQMVFTDFETSLAAVKPHIDGIAAATSEVVDEQSGYVPRYVDIAAAVAHPKFDLVAGVDGPTVVSGVHGPFCNDVIESQGGARTSGQRGK
jgi:hypothetical protein